MKTLFISLIKNINTAVLSGFKTFVTFVLGSRYFNLWIKSGVSENRMVFHKEKWKMFGFILSFRAKKKKKKSKQHFSYLEQIHETDLMV